MVERGVDVFDQARVEEHAMAAASARAFHLDEFQCSAGASAVQGAEQVAKRGESQSAGKLHAS